MYQSPSSVFWLVDSFICLTDMSVPPNIIINITSKNNNILINKSNHLQIMVVCSGQVGWRERYFQDMFISSDYYIFCHSSANWSSSTTGWMLVQERTLRSSRMHCWCGWLHTKKLHCRWATTKKLFNFPKYSKRARN